MISRYVGILLKKNTKTRTWWAKLAICIVLSNIFFFLLFGASESAPQPLPKTSDGVVEVQLSAQLLTPFQEGKKVLFVNRGARRRVEGVLKTAAEAGVIASVNEKDALILLAEAHWEVLPYLKDFRFTEVRRGETYEIRY